MNIKKIMMACMLMLGFVSASAQEPQAKDKAVFQPHWYVTVQPLGAQYTLGEVSFGKLLSYNAQVAVGYEFGSVVGARLAVGGWTSKAGGGTKRFSDGTIFWPDYKWKWNYIAPTLDITFNMSNLLFGYNPDRLLNVGVFVGAGANIGFKNDEANTLAAAQKAAFAAARAAKLKSAASLVPDDYETFRYLWDGTKTRLVGQGGVTLDFRLSRVLSLNVELQANVLSDHYNSKRAGNLDWYFNGLAGLKINLGKKVREIQYVEPVQPVTTQYVEKIVEKPVEKVVEKVVEKEVFRPQMRRDVFFTISSTKVHKNEEYKVQDIADFMKQHPDSKVTITGYADKQTGSHKFNLSLSERRAQVVKDHLINNYGIDASRITIEGKGDTEQPFPQQVRNRVSICIVDY